MGGGGWVGAWGGGGPHGLPARLGLKATSHRSVDFVNLILFFFVSSPASTCSGKVSPSYCWV